MYVIRVGVESVIRVWVVGSQLARLLANFISRQRRRQRS
jgi:hypothetical protein